MISVNKQKLIGQKLLVVGSSFLLLLSACTEGEVFPESDPEKVVPIYKKLISGDPRSGASSGFQLADGKSALVYPTDGE